MSYFNGIGRGKEKQFLNQETVLFGKVDKSAAASMTWRRKRKMEKQIGTATGKRKVNLVPKTTAK